MKVCADPVTDGLDVDVEVIVEGTTSFVVGLVDDLRDG